jgi:hypothetical protein
MAEFWSEEGNAMAAMRLGTVGLALLTLANCATDSDRVSS